MCVIRYEASSDDEKLSYVSLYSYFYSRKRCGVVSNCYTGVKDMYLVPLASHQPIPPELLPFDGPGKAHVINNLSFSTSLVKSDQLNSWRAELCLSIYYE